MNIEEERAHYSMDRAKIDQYVDSIMVLVKDQEANPVAYMAMDLVFRPYLKWLQTAYIDRADPTLVRNSLVNVMSIMIMETATRMNSCDEDGNREPLECWLGEFMIDLRDELITDLDNLIGKRGTTE